MYFKHIFTNKSSIAKLPIASSIPLKSETEKLIVFSKTPFFVYLYLKYQYIYIWLKKKKKEPRFYLLKQDYYIIIKRPPFVWFLTPESMRPDTIHETPFTLT